ncbi:MAG: restriction endonuclease [Gemmatimonadetes bacterium]|nr:restriction endonuclease [Gemmatimonadota bacterium]
MQPEALPLVLYAILLAVAVRLVWWFVRRGRRRIRHLEDLLALTPAQFEEAIAALFRRMGYRSVERTGKAGDLAADIRCTDKAGRSLVVQCKRYAPENRVGSRDIQTFIGMATVHHKAEQGIFVTTSTFTEPARDLAEEHSLILYDGEDLGRLLRKVRISNIWRDVA